MTASIARRAATAVVAIATIVAIVGAAVILFLNPIYVGLEQNRTGVSALTGYSRDEVGAVTGSVLSDLVFGPPSFDVVVRGEPVFKERERGHLVDVRGAFLGLGAAVGLALVILAAARVLGDGAPWFWRAIGRGATALAWGVVVVGVVAGVAFEAAFEIFHRLFFAGGTYTFDPSTDRLVQLFPESFWFETSVALAVVVLGIAVAVVSAARRRAGPAARTELVGAGATR